MTTILCCWLFVLSSALACANGVPALLSYQGRIAADSTVFDGTGHFKFALVDSTGAARFWGNAPDTDADGQPDQGVHVTVARGLFSVQLGDTALPNMAELPPTVFTNSAVYLRVWFSEDGEVFEHLAPDQRIVAVGYAFMAAAVPDGSLTAEKLAPGILSFANLAGALGPAQVPELDAAKLASGTLNPERIPALDAAKITSGALETARIPALDASKLVSGVLDAARLPALDASAITSGAFDAARIPGLNTAQIVSGRMDPARLPADLAYRGTDLLSMSNTLSSQFALAQAGLGAQVTALTANLASLSAQVQALASQSDGSTARGHTAVSTEPNDSALLASGFTPFMTVPSPGWTSGATDGEPAARFAHSAVWTGEEWIVWGGSLGGGILSGSGGIYQPATGQWRAVSPLKAPAERTDHSAVWTGSEMIVWGGFSSGGYLNTGARLTLDPQLWTATTAGGAPDGRTGHVALWTGSRMLIWGGRNSTGLLNDGALYDPVSDRWTTLEVANPPSARFDAAAVWTGDRVMIWGGETSAGLSGSGFELRFNSSGQPASWQPMPASGAPSARTGHAAVWTGARLIVWGGAANGTPLGDGAMYDPSTGQWQALASTGAPGARSGHSAAWSGTEMIVWGGDTAAGATASGGALAPAQNSWRALSLAGNPQPRANAPAAWTGLELVVFGGRADGQPVGALQRLNPQPAWHFYRKL